jgi:hypothetical protein
MAKRFPKIADMKASWGRFMTFGGLLSIYQDLLPTNPNAKKEGDKLK